MVGVVGPSGCLYQDSAESEIRVIDEGLGKARHRG
jgi:hypothetical protein